MNAQSDFPFGLLRAGIELHLRVTKLLHENGQRWVELGSRVSKEGIEEYQSELENLLHTDNWQRLATLPSEAFWRQFQQRFADNQTAVQTAIEAQAAFTHGLQQALQTWQQETAGNAGSASAALPFTDFFKSWGAAWTADKPQPARKGGHRAS